MCVFLYRDICVYECARVGVYACVCAWVCARINMGASDRVWMIFSFFANFDHPSGGRATT